MRRTQTLLMLAGLITTGPALAGPGELDATFGENGRVAITLAGPSFGGGGAQQADGRLLIVGGTFTSQDDLDIAVLRLNTDGTLDGAFGTGGVATADFGGTFEEAYVLLLQGDGKMVAVGQSTDFSQFVIALARFNADGSVDATFGTNGRVTLDLGGTDDYALGAVLQPDGRIVVAGASDVNGDYDMAIARFNADGSLDTTFGTNGSVLVDSDGRHDQANWLTRQPDGKLIACGHGGPEPYNALGSDMEAVRLNADGSLDVTFGTNGVATVVNGTQLGMALGCAALSDGMTVLSGFSGSPGAADLALARLAGDGTLDTTFGSGGQSHLDLGKTDIAQQVMLLSDGKLGVSGLTEDGDDGDPTDLFIARINADGTIDPTFGRNGVTIADFGSTGVSSDVFPGGVFAQADGKLVAVGTAFEEAIAIARVDPAGAGSIGVVGLVETSAAVAEGTASVVLTARRTGGSVGAIDIDVGFANGTALSPGDYTGTSVVLSWADGDTTDQTITIPITDDTVVESAESFGVTLSTSTAGLALAATEATITIDDTDVAPPPPPPAPTQGGGGGGGTFGVELLVALLGLGLLRRVVGRRAGLAATAWAPSRRRR